VVPVFLLIGVGGVARRLDWISGPGEQTLLKLVVNILYPAFLFWLVSRNESLRQEGLIVTAILTGFLFVCAGYVVCFLVAPLFGMGEWRERRTFTFTGGVYNYGYFAVPVCTPLFGLDATGVLMVVTVGVELAMWSLGVLIVSGEISRRTLRRMVSPPVIAIFVAIAFNLLDLTAFIPSFAMETLDLLGRCAIPLGLVMIGATISQLMREEPLLARPAVALGACVTRLGVMPLVMIGAFLLLARGGLVPVILQQVALVHAAMPAAVFPIVLTRLFHGRTDIALRTVIPTCFVSLITIPLWIQVGLDWFRW